MVTRRLIRISPEERAARLAAAAKRTNKADCTVKKHDNSKGLTGGCSEAASKCDGVISDSAKSAGSRRRKRPLHHVEKTDDKRGQKRQKGMQKFIDLADIPKQLPIINNRNNATSKYQGVYFHTRDSKWMARILIDGKRHHIGYYDDEEEAAVDYARAVFKYRAGDAEGGSQQKGNKLIDLTDVPKKPPIISNTDGASKYLGVSFDKATKKWRANIRINGKRHHIGTYVDEEEAAVDYARAVFKHRGGNVKVAPVKFINLSDVPAQVPILSNRGGASKYQGVYFDNSRNKWVARITIEGKNYSIGRYDDEKEAAVDYARAEFKYKTKGQRVQKMTTDLTDVPAQLPIRSSKGGQKRQRGSQNFIDLTDVPKKSPIISSNTDGTSKYHGVSFDKARNKWRAKIKIDGKGHHIGYYDDEEEAAVDYARAVFKYSRKD